MPAPTANAGVESPNHLSMSRIAALARTWNSPGNAREEIPAFPDVSVPSRNMGQKLPDATREKMEKSLKEDFSGVRIHIDRRAESLDAHAYARDDNLHFNPGEYNPHSRAGLEKIGHELAHVKQRRRGKVKAPSRSGLPLAPINRDTGLEREADLMGAKAARGETAVHGDSPRVVPGANVNADSNSAGVIQRNGGKDKKKQGSYFTPDFSFPDFSLPDFAKEHPFLTAGAVGAGFMFPMLRRRVFQNFPFLNRHSPMLPMVRPRNEMIPAAPRAIMRYQHPDYGELPTIEYGTPDSGELGSYKFATNEIFLDKNMSPQAQASTRIHEETHWKDHKAGRLTEDFPATAEGERKEFFGRLQSELNANTAEVHETLRQMREDGFTYEKSAGEHRGVDKYKIDVANMYRQDPQMFRMKVLQRYVREYAPSYQQVKKSDRLAMIKHFMGDEKSL